MSGNMTGNLIAERLRAAHKDVGAGRYAQQDAEPDDLIVAIARQVRRTMVQGPVAGPVCGEAAAAVTEALLKEGFGAVQVQGHVVGEPVGLLLYADLGHCWTEVDGLVVDATIDQLNPDGAAYPPVLVRPRADCPEYLSEDQWCPTSSTLTSRSTRTRRSSGR